MKKRVLAFATAFLIGAFASAQHIEFQEYNLPNGLHVILHQDKTVPVVTTSVMYHVGAKDEAPGRSGFAHFFEHLLFEGTPNIKRGEWMKIVSAHGGSNNANTTNDRTYYYETFPSNNEQLGLWMEAERMRHAVINQIGVDTQREVVKEEKRQSLDNRPYGNLITAIQSNLFTKSPYHNTTIGSMEDINNAKLSEFEAFYKKYYIPNNATLVVAGDINIPQTKKWIEDYYASIPKGAPISRDYATDAPITQEKVVNFYDANIQLPAYLYAYRTPGQAAKDAYVLDMISSYLSGGKSSVLYKQLVDEQKKALQIQAVSLGLEKAGVFVILAIPMGNTPEKDFRTVIDQDIKDLQTNLISDEAYQKLQNQFETDFVNSNSTIQGIASSLATYHVLYGDTNLINTTLNIYRGITKEQIRDVARKYLNNNERVIINYLPEKDEKK